MIVIREEHVIETVAIDVDEPQPGVATVGIDERRALRKREGRFYPLVDHLIPAIDGLEAVIGDKKLAVAVVIDVMESHAAIDAVIGGEDLAFNVQAVEKRMIDGPVIVVPSPAIADGFVADQ